MSTLASVLASRFQFKLTRKAVGWSVLGVLTLAILIFDLPLLDSHHPYRVYHYKVRFPLIPHLILGTTALLIGPLQFSRRMRTAYPHIHRILGRIYVSSVLVAAPLGALITVVGPKDPFFSIGVDVHAAVWFFTTLMAFLTARNGHIAQHRQWMVRSYILTFSFIASRIIGPVWMVVWPPMTPHRYGIIDTGLNVAYLLIADVALNWREITTRRTAQTA